MKSTQNTTIKQKSGIYLSKNKKTAIAVLILIVLCCLFSTIAQASDISVDLNNIASIEMYGYDETLSTQAWRTITYTITGDVLTTQDIVYGQRMQRYKFTLNETVMIHNVSIEFEYIGKNISKYSTAESYLPKLYIPQTATTAYNGTWELTNQYTENNDIYKVYKITFNVDNIEKNTNNLTIISYFNVISTKINIKNFKFIINGEVYKIINTIENEINNIEEKAQEAHNAVTNDEYNYDDPTLAIRATNSSVNNALQYISEHIYSLDNVVLYQNIFQVSPTLNLVFVLSLTFALLSYVLFGKVI